MKKAAYTFLLLILDITGSFSQSGNNPVLESLFFYDRPIPTISWDGFKYLDPVNERDNRFEQFPQCLIRNSKGLFVYINGTSRLYQAVMVNGKIDFKRLDSTVYFGSNFRSLVFSYKDVIYNLGGYGFWKTNGLLRYYVEKRREWEIIKLNKEIPLQTENSFDLIWYDQPEEKIYFGFTREENNVTTDEKSSVTFHYETMILDLEKKEWRKLGLLSNFLKNDLVNLTNITSGPLGQMVNFKGKTLFLNYRENKIYELNLAPKKQKIMDRFSTNTGDAHVYYFKDSVFFSGISSRNLLDSLSISKKDLVLLDEKIYLPDLSQTSGYEKARSTVSKFIIVLLAGLAILTAIILFLIRKKKTVSSDLKSNHTIEYNIFTELETEVLKTIAGNSQKATLTSIDDLNKVLGVNKKSIEIQKKQRSDVISSINKKYSYIKKDNGELIERKQTEFDKRSFEYYIDYYKLRHVSSFIDQNSGAYHK